MKSDQFVGIILVTCILLYVAVLVIGLITSKGPWLTSLLNLVAGVSIIVYWIQKELRIKTHYIEAREIAVLCLELAVIGLAIYSLSTIQRNNWLKILQYTFFGVHLLCLVLFLIFMLTFKMNKMI